MNPLQEMLQSQKKQDLFYCNHWGSDCFYMVFRPMVFEESVMCGNFIMMVCGDMDDLNLTAQVTVTNTGAITMWNICYEYSDSFSDDVSNNNFKEETYYESALDVIACMFGENIVVENTVSNNYLVDNSIWDEMESVVETYYATRNGSWGNFQLFDYE